MLTYSVEGFCKSTKLREVTIESAELGMESLKHLQKYLHNFGDLKKLSLRNCSLDSNLLRLLIPESSLQFLDFSNNQLDFQTFEGIGKLLPKLESLEILRLNHCFATNEGTIRIFSGIFKNQTLREFEFRGQNLREVKNYVREVLVSNQFLRHCDLSETLCPWTLDKVNQLLSQTKLQCLHLDIERPKIFWRASQVSFLREFRDSEIDSCWIMNRLISFRFEFQPKIIPFQHPFFSEKQCFDF